MIREIVINDFDGWCSAMGNSCPIICCHALAILKEQESIIKSLKADLSETLDIVTNRKNVTHCKDCKHNDDPDYPCERHTICTNAVNDENWFCADGQMKEGL